MTEQNKPQQSKGSIVFMGIVALLFSYIVTKDVALPPVVLYGGFMVGGILLFFKGLSKPEVVTYVLVAYLPFSRILVGDFGGLATAFNLTNLLMGFIIVVWLTGKYSEGEPLWLKTNLNFPIILFMFAGFVALARGHYLAGHMLYAIIEYKRWITPIFLYFLVLNTVKDRWMIQNVITLMVIVITIVGLMAIYDYIEVGTVSRLEKARIGGISEQPNQLAAFFCYYMFIPFAFFLRNMHKPKYWLLLVPFLICFRGIMVTFSRGGYLAFATGLMAICWFRSKLVFALLILFAFLAYMNPELLPGGIRYRMGQTMERQAYVETELSVESLESSSQTRVEVWKGAIAMIKDHPFFGVGYGLFQPMIKYYWSGESEIDAHNTYLILAAEMGIPTLLIFLWIIWMAFWNTLRLYKTTNDEFTKSFALGFLGGIFGLLMGNMFGSRLIAQEVSSYLWILMALVQRLRILDEREQGVYTGLQKIGYRLET